MRLICSVLIAFIAWLILEVVVRMFRRFKARSRSETNQQMHEKTFKRLQNTIKQVRANVLRGKIERSYVSLVSLEIKAQKTKKPMIILKDKLSYVLPQGHPSMMKCLKLGVASSFRGFKYSRKLLLMLFLFQPLINSPRVHCLLHVNVQINQCFCSSSFLNSKHSRWT